MLFNFKELNKFRYTKRRNSSVAPFILDSLNWALLFTPQTVYTCTSSVPLVTCVPTSSRQTCFSSSSSSSLILYPSKLFLTLISLTFHFYPNFLLLRKYIEDLLRRTSILIYLEYRSLIKIFQRNQLNAL